jgi:hypothetical protein
MNAWPGELACRVQMHYLERLGRRPSAGTKRGLDSLSSDTLLADLR